MLGNRRPVPANSDGFRELDAHCHVLIPERLRRELLQQRELQRQHEQAHDGTPDQEDRAADPSAAGSQSDQRDPRDWRQLYDAVQVQSALAALPAAARANDRMSQEKSLLTRLASGDPMRKVARPGVDWRKRLDRLRQEFPNFAEVLSAVERGLVLARCAGEPPVLPPMLLVGDPGVGKSLFVERLGMELFGQRVRRFQVETSGIADALVGTEKHWSTSGPGAIFDLLVSGAYINPTIMLDELDKAPQRQTHAGLVKVLYAMLEPESARRFSDQSLPEVTIDASHIGWIATANHIEPIERPLLDRFQAFHIPAPTSEQAQSIVRRIEAQLRKRYGQRRLPPLPQDLVEQLATLAPRRAGKLMLQLLASLAVRDARAYGAPEQALVEAEVKAAAAQAAARAEQPLTEAEKVRGIMTLSTVAAIKALEIAGQQARMHHVATAKKKMH